MYRTIAIVASVVLVLGGAYAFAQMADGGMHHSQNQADHTKHHAQHHRLAQAQGGAHHGQNGGMGQHGRQGQGGPHHQQGGQNQQAGQGMMGGKMMQMMDQPMRLRMQAMMNRSLAPNDPATLLALKDRLQLTDEQIQNLESIAEDARQEAEQVLTDQQKEQLAPLGQGPTTMRGMHQHMMQRMKQQGMMGQNGQKQGNGQGQGMMNKKNMMMQCPMMQMMHQHLMQGGGMGMHDGQMGGSQDEEGQSQPQGQSQTDHEAHH